MAGSKRQNTGKIERDYVLHDPHLRYLLETLENYGHQMDEERYDRIESQVSEQMEKVRTKAFNKNQPDPFKKEPGVIVRPRSAVSPKRDYVLHEPRFRDLQENYMKYYKRPTTADQTKADVRRKKRFAAVVKDKKKELLEMRMANIDELKEQLEELEEMGVEDMANQEIIEHRQRISSLKARIQREMKGVRVDFLPQPVPCIKPYKPEPVLEWKNPPQYDKTAPHLRQVMEVNKIYGAHMDATRKAILDSTVEHILANDKEYAAWKRQIRQNVEEKLRNEGVQPVKLRQKPKMTTTMWDRKSLPHVTRVYGEQPEYELEEPSYRYLANIEENFLHLRQAEAKKRFCNRFLKAREIELRKQQKREQRIEKARQVFLQKQNQEPEKLLQHSVHWNRNISRDYVKHEPLFRYIENVKLNYYDYLTPQQKNRIDEKYQEMKKQKEMMLKLKYEKHEKICQEHPENCLPLSEEPVPDPELNWTPRTDYVLHEPPFRYYEDFKNQYLPYLNKKQKKVFLAKYKQAKAVENEKRKKKQEKEEMVAQENVKSEKESEKEELPPVTPRTGYDLNAPGFRYVQNTAENYEAYLGETSKEPFMQKYEAMKTAEKERLEKLEKRQEAAYQKHLEKHPALPELPPSERNIEAERNYELSDPRFVHLYDTWMRYKDQIPENRRDYGENLLKKLSEKAETTQKTHEKRCQHAYKIRYPDQGDILDDSDSAEDSVEDTGHHPTETERQDRIARLATPNRRLLETNYKMYKDLMSEDKAKRIKMTVDRMRPISMEQMEAELKQKKMQQKLLRERSNYRYKHKPGFMSRLEDEAYKKLIIRLLHKSLHQLPSQILYSGHRPHLSSNQEKIYHTAMTNFTNIPALSNNQPHLHGLTMQIVKFFDKILN